MTFRFPEGVDYLGTNGEHAEFKVAIPADEDGFLGRECPDCDQHFRVAMADYLGLPDDTEFCCVYCGYSADHRQFMTQQQHDRARRALGDYAIQLVQQSLSKAATRGGPRPRGASIGISFRTRPFYPASLPEIDEERLVRERSCDGCGLRYAVFGEHRFCPQCGPLLPLATALDALAAEAVRLDVFTDLPEDTSRKIRERGVVDRTWVDVIENVVGIVETLADRTFRQQVDGADDVLRGRGNVFQRLEDCADLYLTEVGIDIRADLGALWPELLATWAARHVLVHRDGIVDAKYLKSVPTSGLSEGQRLQVTERLARAAIHSAELLCRSLGADR